MTSTETPSKNALVRIFELDHQFLHLDDIVLHPNMHSLPIVRSSPGEREKWLSALENGTVLAETTPRNRCDPAFCLTDKCMDKETRNAFDEFHATTGNLESAVSFCGSTS